MEDMNMCGMFNNGLEERTFDDYLLIKQNTEMTLWGKAFQTHASRQHGSYLEQKVMDFFMARA